DSFDMTNKILKDDSASVIKIYKNIDSAITKFKENPSILSSGRNVEKEILGRLLLLKVEYLAVRLIEKEGVLYNLNRSDYENFTNFNGVLEVCQILDEVIALNISETLNLYCKKLRMKYIVESGAFYEIGDKDSRYPFKWYNNNSSLGIKKLPQDQRDVAKIFLEDEKTTKFVPFDSYSAIGLGTIGAIGKSNWLGGEISLDFTDLINPFRKDYISDIPNLRVNFLSSAILWNLNDLNRRDILFSMLNLRNPLVYLKLFQFGNHIGISDKLKWFYRPEIGFSYGIFNISYAYNLTFNKSVRNVTEKSLFTFGISYPVVRISKYFK
ncbi:MAG: hypothetical protein ACOVQG_00250, partial [Crocinitomicaceae bacterium]